MSVVKDNLITKGLSGKLGNQVVFRQWSGTTLLAKVPAKSSKASENEAHLKALSRFKEASVYGKK
jgi:hypothetical protein